MHASNSSEPGSISQARAVKRLKFKRLLRLLSRLRRRRILCRCGRSLHWRNRRRLLHWFRHGVALRSSFSVPGASSRHSSQRLFSSFCGRVRLQRSGLRLPISHFRGIRRRRRQRIARCAARLCALGLARTRTESRLFGRRCGFQRIGRLRPLFGSRFRQRPGVFRRRIRRCCGQGFAWRLAVTNLFFLAGLFRAPVRSSCSSLWRRALRRCVAAPPFIRGGRRSRSRFLPESVRALAEPRPLYLGLLLGRGRHIGAEANAGMQFAVGRAVSVYPCLIQMKASSRILFR